MRRPIESSAALRTWACAPHSTLAMSAGPRSVAGSVNAWRAIRRAVTPLQVSEAGVVDFVVTGRTFSLARPTSVTSGTVASEVAPAGSGRSARGPMSSMCYALPAPDRCHATPHERRRPSNPRCSMHSRASTATKTASSPMRLSAPRHQWSITPTTKNRAGNLGLRGASPHRRSEQVEGVLEEVSNDTGGHRVTNPPGKAFKPAGYNSVSPYLVVAGAQELMDS